MRITRSVVFGLLAPFLVVSVGSCSRAEPPYVVTGWTVADSSDGLSLSVEYTLPGGGTGRVSAAGPIGQLAQDCWMGVEIGKQIPDCTRAYLDFDARGRAAAAEAEAGPALEMERLALDWTLSLAGWASILVGTFLIAAPELASRKGALGLHWLPGDGRLVRWINHKFELDRDVRLWGFGFVCLAVALGIAAKALA